MPPSEPISPPSGLSEPPYKEQKKLWTCSDKIAQENADKMYVGKLNVDDAPEIASQYGISSIPCFILFENGQEKGRTVGVQDKGRLLASINA